MDLKRNLTEQNLNLREKRKKFKLKYKKEKANKKACG
jgi:hypothetical protein